MRPIARTARGTATAAVLAVTVIALAAGTVDEELCADTAFVVPRDPMRIVRTGDRVALDTDRDPRFALSQRAAEPRIG